MNKNVKKILIVGIPFVAFTVGAFYAGSYYQFHKISEEFLSAKEIRAKNNAYPLVNRLIGTEIPSATSFGFYVDTKKSIEEILAKKQYAEISHFSLYFRDLNTGLWFGVNENEEYIPASLFKVPIAITYFKHAIADKNLFTSTLPYTSKEVKQLQSVENLDPSTLVLGQSYTVLGLIEKMLINSDNGAQRVLANNINQSFLNDLYSIIEVSGPAQNNYYISPKEYALFLRMLYSGSYLGQEKSEQLLELLGKTNFAYGIKKGVPTNVTVIHKFGSVNTVNKNTDEKIAGIHDCGIIYYPDKPYVLCIMTEGKDQATEVKAIEEVSSYIFKYIQNQ